MFFLSPELPFLSTPNKNDLRARALRGLTLRGLTLRSLICGLAVAALPLSPALLRPAQAASAQVTASQGTLEMRFNSKGPTSLFYKGNQLLAPDGIQVNVKVRDAKGQIISAPRGKTVSSFDARTSTLTVRYDWGAGHPSLPNRGRRINCRHHAHQRFESADSQRLRGADGVEGARRSQSFVQPEPHFGRSAQHRRYFAGAR